MQEYGNSRINILRRAMAAAAVCVGFTAVTPCGAQAPSDYGTSPDGIVSTNPGGPGTRWHYYGLDSIHEYLATPPTDERSARVARASIEVYQRGTLEPLKGLLKPGPGVLQFENSVNDLDEALDKLREALRSDWSHTGPAISAAQAAWGKVTTALAGLAPGYQTLVAATAPPSSLGPLSSGKFGVLFAPRPIYQFDSFTESGVQEPNRPGSSWANVPYLFATGLVAIDSPQTPVTARFGLGELDGDPNCEILGVSASSYFSPSFADASVSLSKKLRDGGLNPSQGESQSLAAKNWEANRARALVDYVRPGDVWLSASLRGFAGSVVGPTAVAPQLNLVFAKRSRDFTHADESPAVATTLTLSGAYCTSPSYRLSEFAIEARLPVAGFHVKEKPTYLTLRYGSFNELTISLEFALGK